MRSIFLTKHATAILSLCLAGWCHASEISVLASPQATSGGSELRSLPTNQIDVARRAAVLGEPLASVELSDLRGGFDVVKNDMKLNGTVSNNTAVDVITGSNYIANGSFSNSSGFPMVVQNSGSNVLIQNATIINLQYQ